MTQLEILKLAIETVMNRMEREKARLNERPSSQIARHHYEKYNRQYDFLHAEILKLETE